MIGARRDDPKAVFVEQDAWCRLDHFDLRFPREIGVMSKAVLDVGTQHRAQSVHHRTGARRTEKTQGLRNHAHDPVGRDDVVEVADVIAVQMCEEDSIEHDG